MLMPCRNAHVGFLEEALASVFAQTSGAWHLLVIDDGSDSPDTLEALAALAGRRDDRVRVVRSRSARITGALNTGMREARTPFVCTLHCDDLLEGWTNFSSSFLYASFVRFKQEGDTFLAFELNQLGDQPSV